MIQDRDYNRNIDTYDILSLLAEWDTKRESYALKTQIHDPYTSTYMEALSGKNPEKYFKAMDDEIQSLMRKNTFKIVSRK